MSRGGHGDQQVFDDYGHKPEALATAAAAIQANLKSITEHQADEDEPEVEDAPEGALLTRVHRVRERNTKIVKRKKDTVTAHHGRLKCEACGFDFAKRYGSMVRASSSVTTSSP